MRFKGTGYPSNPNHMGEMILEQGVYGIAMHMSNFAESSPRVQSAFYIRPVTKDHKAIHTKLTLKLETELLYNSLVVA